MALQTIPVLVEEYPLFDWADYQSSRDALVKDHLVSDFTKEAWNAIVDTLSAALAAGGLEWDDKYTTAEGAKITQAYGALSAAMFNSVRHNIDHPASIGWAWAREEDFRGYVGREDFRGHSVYGAKCDYFYPEYIIELVRKLNLLIEIMRDTANISNAAYKGNQKSLILPNLLAKPSAPMAYTKLSESKILGGGVALPSAPLTVDFMASANISAALLPRLSAALVGDGSSMSDTASTLKQFKAALVKAQQKSKSLDSAELIKRTAIRAYASEMAYSGSVGDMDAWKAFLVFSHIIAKSSEVARAVQIPSVPVSVSKASRSSQNSDITASESKPIKAADQSETSTDADITPCEGVGIQVATSGETACDAEISPCEGLKIKVEGKSTADCFADLDGIISSRAEIKINSGTLVLGQIDSAWYPPIWEGDALYIRQTLNNKQEDDILHIDETPDMAVAECTRSKAFAQLDIAWLPPEWVDGALLIHQAYETTQTDDELEVV